MRLSGAARFASSSSASPGLDLADAARRTRRIGSEVVQRKGLAFAASQRALMMRRLRSSRSHAMGESLLFSASVCSRSKRSAGLGGLHEERDRGDRASSPSAGEGSRATSPPAGAAPSRSRRLLHLRVRRPADFLGVSALLAVFMLRRLKKSLRCAWSWRPWPAASCAGGTRASPPDPVDREGARRTPRSGSKRFTAFMSRCCLPEPGRPAAARTPGSCARPSHEIRP